MQAARSRAVTAGHGGFASFNNQFQSDPGFSRTSTYTARSRVVNKRVRSSRSFWEVADAIAWSCSNCFAPRPSKLKEGHEIPPNGGHDVSISSISRISSASSTSTNTSRQRGDNSQKKSWEEQFSFQEVCMATSNFSEQNKIGLGNFGTVYKGTLRNGSIIAVKRATKVHAIAYLHGYTDHPIIHRDIKSSNILLTEHLRAKVTDFGFARLAPDNTEATHISTLVKGTAGYVDPEYLRTNQLTDRSDVYSFGVLLVELITGRRPIERRRGRQQRLTTQWSAAEVQGGRDGGGDGPQDAEDQRGRGGGGEGDGAGGGVHGPGARGAAGHAAVRRGALVREARLPAGAAARGRRGRGRERTSEAARWLDVRAPVDHEFEAGEVERLRSAEYG
ncbi:hypothetical protein ACP4OV_029994 [Aristida adscensionis]